MSPGDDQVMSQFKGGRRGRDQSRLDFRWAGLEEMKILGRREIRASLLKTGGVSSVFSCVLRCLIFRTEAGFRWLAD